MSRSSNRMHLTKEGRPKVAYPDAGAAAEAALRMEERRGTPFSYYECTHDECTLRRVWHIGRMPARLRSRHTRYIDFVELGPRVAYNLVAENVGTTETRCARLARRGRRCQP